MKMHSLYCILLLLGLALYTPLAHAGNTSPASTPELPKNEAPTEEAMLLPAVILDISESNPQAARWIISLMAENKAVINLYHAQHEESTTYILAVFEQGHYTPESVQWLHGTLYSQARTPSVQHDADATEN